MKENSKYTFKMAAPSEFMTLYPSLVACCGCFRELYRAHGFEFSCSPGQEAENILHALQHNNGNVRLPIAYEILGPRLELVACALLSESDYMDAIMLSYVYVHPEHRRQGLGTKLVQGVLHEAGMRFPGCKVVFNVVECNEAAKAMYRKLGLLEKPFEVWYDLTDSAKRFALEDRPL